MSSEINDIFRNIEEFYETPIRIGSRCESNVYYRIEDLQQEDVSLICDYLGERVEEVCQPDLPDLIVNLATSVTHLPEQLAARLGDIEVIDGERVHAGNGVGSRLRGSKVLLVNEVITTARSCLEVHTQITMMGATVVSWASLIDRTFGPGPVPVIAAFNGEPVQLLEKIL